MAKLVDAPASGAGACKGVEVRVFFWAPKIDEPRVIYCTGLFLYLITHPLFLVAASKSMTSVFSNKKSRSDEAAFFHP
jgi:hypothetical protein